MQFKISKVRGKKRNIDKIAYVQAPSISDAVAIAAKIPGDLNYIKQITYEEYIKAKLKK